MRQTLYKREARLSDEELVALCLNDEDSAFEELIGRYETPILNFIYRVIRNRARAEELAQETFIRVFKNLGSFDVKYRFSTWIYTIAKNLARTELSEKSREPKPQPLGEEYGLQTKKNTSPEAMAQGRELAGSIERLLWHLPEHYRMAILLREYRNMSYEQIAEIFDCPEGTVKTWIFRAKKELAAGLRKLGYDI